MADNPMHLREFIKNLDECLKEFEKDKDKPVEAEEIYSLGYLAGIANQDGAEEELYDLADDIDDDIITKDDVIIKLKDIGKLYDV